MFPQCREVPGPQGGWWARSGADRQMLWSLCLEQRRAQAGPMLICVSEDAYMVGTTGYQVSLWLLFLPILEQDTDRKSVEKFGWLCPLGTNSGYSPVTPVLDTDVTDTHR